ncbi:hypothetical protein J4526_01760 [Desulfurococcaceae archaeon MEX13E-LK6-19]|nr:hypothetical protein J4526_01760 [Desulfurococcaceae archaeon MEX13E-LK6-19]
MQSSVRLLRKLSKHGTVIYAATIVVVRINPRVLGGLIKKNKNVKVVDSVVVLPQLA